MPNERRAFSMKLHNTPPKVSPVFFRIFERYAEEKEPTMWWPKLRALLDIAILTLFPFLIYDQFYAGGWAGVVFYSVFWLRIFYDFSGPDLRRKKKFSRIYP